MNNFNINDTINNEKYTCRLCLQDVSSRDKRVIEKSTKAELEMLLINMDFYVSKNPVMCTVCSFMYKKGITFKRKCLRNESLITGLLKTNLKREEILVKAHKLFNCVPLSNPNEKLEMKSKNICRLCFFECENTLNMLPKDMCRYIPEVDLTVSHSLICSRCSRSLVNIDFFSKNCNRVEDRIIAFHDNGGIDIYGYVCLEKLKGTAQINSKQVDKIKTESVEEDDSIFIKNECLADAGNEEKMLVSVSQVKIENNCERTYENDESPSRETEILSTIKAECFEATDHELVDLPEFYVKNEENELKSENSDDRPRLDPQNENKVLDHEISEEVAEEEEDATSDTFDFSMLSVRKRMNLICKVCNYTTTHKYNFKKHLTTHSKPSDPWFIKCNQCDYKAKHRDYMWSHKRIHQDASQVKLFKCNSCNFQTKFKSSLTTHAIKHKDPSEIPLYHCASCSFATKRKGYLQNHVLLHMDPSKVEMHKCHLCQHQTMNKYNLKRHMISHVDPSEVEANKGVVMGRKVQVFKCKWCEFKSVKRGEFIRHRSAHKNIEMGLKMYKCTWCPYKENYKHLFLRHLKQCKRGA